MLVVHVFVKDINIGKISSSAAGSVDAAYFVGVGVGIANSSAVAVGVDYERVAAITASRRLHCRSNI